MKYDYGDLAQSAHEFLLKDFQPHFGELTDSFCTFDEWRALRSIGSELWLDTGDATEIAKASSREFSAVTTNNTLLNREVMSGRYDQFIHEAGDLLQRFNLDEHRQRLEMAFLLNGHHALSLVERFDLFVSVEEHTDLAFNVGEALEYARRYYALCPERFYVKIPLTSAGLLATRLAQHEGIPVNHTLGFSARQNYLVARIARPEFVNVFLGRLSSFVADNRIGDGLYVGERATVASQQAIRDLRHTHDVPCRQIAASFRSPQQLFNLAGIDVLTMPASVAEGFRAMHMDPGDIHDRSSRDYQPTFDKDIDPAAIRLDTLWDISDRLVAAVDELEEEDLDRYTPLQLEDFLSLRGCGDILVRWTDEQRQVSQAEGKIPQLDNWRSLLGGKVIGLDSLLNLAGLGSFASDQAQMDQHVLEVLSQVSG